MKQNMNPAIIGIVIAVVVILIGVIGYFSFFHTSSEPAPGVSSSSIAQQYQNRVTQERPTARGTH